MTGTLGLQINTNAPPLLRGSHGKACSSSGDFFAQVMRQMHDPRRQYGLLYSYPLLGFCLLLTELSGLRRQRQRACWLEGNWDWITSMAQVLELGGSFDSSPSQSTISRFCSRADAWHICQLYQKELRILEKAPFEQREDKSSIPVNEWPHVAVDGKRREGCRSSATGRTEIDLTFFRTDTREVICSTVCPDKEGEAVSARKALSMYGHQLPPSILTFDAGITGPAFIKEAVKKGHGYIGAIKGNAGKVFDILKNGSWDKSALKSESGIGIKKHGRIEKRTIEIFRITAFPGKKFSKYTKCSSVARVTRLSEENGIKSEEIRYFILCKNAAKLTPGEILQRIRDHWLQENGLHWSKDAVLGEDDLPPQSKKSSRLLGFMKNIVISVAWKKYKSTQKFIDRFLASPKKLMESLIFSN